MAENFLKPLKGKVRHKPIAVFDLETIPNLTKAYLAGFYDGTLTRIFEVIQNDKTKSIPTFPEDTKGSVSQLLSWLFSQDTYCRHWIYAHNGGNFDFLYLVRWLLSHGDNFSFEIIPIQSSILCLKVTDKTYKNNARKWTFLDSYRLLNASLDKLGKVFLGESKIEGINYNTLHKDPRRYEYLTRDLRLNYGVVEKFTDLVIRSGGEIGMTAPASAMKSFRRMHLKKWIPINRHFPGCNCDKPSSKRTTT